MAIGKVGGITWSALAKVTDTAKAGIAKVLGVEAPASFTGILDTYPNAGLAYSVRKLRSAYSGSCIRIVRASDSTETDIGFTGANFDLDTSAISTFCSGTTGYIYKWYDQSGNGFDAIGKGYSAQTSLPIIYTGGAVVTLNSKAAIQITHPRMFQYTITGADIADFVTGGASGTDKKTTMHVVGQQGSTTTPYKIVLEDNVDQSEVLWMYESSGAERIDFIGTSASLGALYTDSAQKGWCSQVNGNTFQWFENGTSKGTSTNSSAQSTTNAGVIFNLGGLSFSTRNLEGYFQEIIIWKTAESASGIFTNTDTYFAIP